MSFSGRSNCGSQTARIAPSSCVDARRRRHPAAFDVQLGDALVVAPEEGDEVLRQVVLVAVGQRADDAEIQRDVAAEGRAASMLTWMLPGCMSAWKKPSRKTCVKKIVTPSRASFVMSTPAARSRSTLADRHAVHALHHHHAGRAQVPHHLGHPTRARPSCCAAAAPHWRPRARDRARRAGRRRTRPPLRAASGACHRRSPARPSAPGVRSSARSSSMAASMPGRSTLTATSRPSCRTAKCTCAIDALATGSASKLGEDLVDRLAEGRARRARDCAPGNGGTRSCSLASSSATSAAAGRAASTAPGRT